MAELLNGLVSASRVATLLAGVTPARSGPRYRELACALSALLRDGRVPVHARLPAERELAGALAVSRTTVTAAYDLLREEGYLMSRRGAGSWTTLPATSRPGALGGWLIPDADVEIDLGCAAPLPAAGLLDGVMTELAPRLGDLVRWSGYNPYGLSELRAAIAARYTARGLPTSLDQILVANGSQHALTLIAALLCAPGDRVVVENPTYPNALEMLRRARTRLLAVPIDESGWHIETACALLRQSAPRLAYLTPDFQNPIGRLMPDEERVRVAEAARRAGSWLVIDETLTDISLDVPTPVPFAATVASGHDAHLISVGSMSKSHWGGLRIGWIRAAPRVITELAGVRVGNDIAGSVIDQQIAATLLARPETIEELRGRLRRQRTALADALGEHLPEWSWSQPVGGLSLWVDLGEPISGELVERAARHGVNISSGGRFGVDPGIFEHRLRVPYCLPECQLREAVSRLAAALHGEVAPSSVAASRRWVA